jgi:hypothetical protein
VKAAIRNRRVAARNLDLAPDPYWNIGDLATTDSHDNHLPVILLGPGIRAGEYDDPSIAPTLAAILQVETPSGSVGRALTEMLAR